MNSIVDDDDADDAVMAEVVVIVEVEDDVDVVDLVDVGIMLNVDVDGSMVLLTRSYWIPSHDDDNMIVEHVPFHDDGDGDDDGLTVQSVPVLNNRQIQSLFHFVFRFFSLNQ